MEQKVKVLILCPHPSGQGGVAYYYRLFKKHFRSDRATIEFLYTGREIGSGGRIVKTMTDLFQLMKICADKDLIVVNPSLDPRAVLRDGLFHFCVKVFFRKTTIVFFHGWDSAFEKVINRFFKSMFRVVFNADRILVLAGQFKNKLVEWGIDQGRVFLETTAFERNYLDSDKNPLKTIFMSRFANGKGCLLAIKVIEILREKHKKIKLYMVGDGELRSQLETYVHENRLETSVEFTGWLDGESKYRLLDQCGIMLYPTSYGEGLPICLLEGMGMGLAVVSRPVAGIPDIFENNKNGFLIETLNPADFALKLELLIEDKNLFYNICRNNKAESLRKFEIEKVVGRMENLYLGIHQIA